MLPSSGVRTGMASRRRWHASCARARRTLIEQRAIAGAAVQKQRYRGSMLASGA
jgi:hypothetical protein